MTGFTEIDGILHADGVSLHDIAARHGTPAYVYSAAKIRDSARRLQKAFADALPPDGQPLISYACKACSNIAVLRLMQKEGLGTDIVSGGELARARAAGVDPRKIVFSGVGKTDDEISAALRVGILQFNVESRAELERIAFLAAQAGEKAPVALRFNPDVDAHTHAKISTGKDENKFGMPRGEVLALYKWAAAQPSLHIRGLSVHIGSQLTLIEPFKKAFEKMAAVADEIRAAGLPLEALDLGGGIGIRYRDDDTPPDLNAYAAVVRDTVYRPGLQIIFEPGRFLVGEAGLLLTKALYIKKGESREYLILDAGMNDLIRPALYDSWHTIRPVDADPQRARKLYDVVGPVCETGDTFAVQRDMPEVKAGELVALMAAGAYGFTMASNYNTRPLPPEILIDDGKMAVIRRRQEVQDILDQEIIPAWLK